jgi:glycosyltransferase involved in cell wall biosynthesis
MIPLYKPLISKNEIKNVNACLKSSWISSFEGGPGGFSVYEAISLGKPVIVSDIEVNREILYKNISFFKKNNSHNLKKKIKIFLAKKFISILKKIKLF